MQQNIQLFSLYVLIQFLVIFILKSFVTGLAPLDQQDMAGLTGGGGYNYLRIFLFLMA